MARVVSHFRLFWKYVKTYRSNDKEDRSDRKTIGKIIIRETELNGF
jgi:hypothetical protein